MPNIDNAQQTIPARRKSGARKFAARNIVAAAINAVPFAGLTVIALPAWGAPPLTIDDAGTLAPGTCQFEAEHRQFRNRIEQDIVPVCNFWFDTEVGIGHQRIAPDGAPRSDSIVYQFKKVLVTSDQAGWALGINAATVRASGSQSGTRQNIFNALVSRQVGDTALHSNIGVVSDHEAMTGTRKNKLLWGIAAEHLATDRWTLVGEVFGIRGVPETAQVGLRFWTLPKYMQLTASVGAQRGQGRDGRWISFGVRFETGDSIF